MKYEIGENLDLPYYFVVISDAYESPSSGEVIYQVRRLSNDEFELVYEVDIPEQEH